MLLLYIPILFSTLVTTPTAPPCELHGKVKIVAAHADYDVRIVQMFPDARIRIVEHNPDDAGEWQIVDSHEDFSVRFVPVGGNFTISFVSAWPGCPRRDR
jgi:hypothetical protein